MKTHLRISGKNYEALRTHLFPGDHKEAVAIALCGRMSTADHEVLLVHQILPIPYEDCHVRTDTQVSWSTHRIVPLLETAARKRMAILKIHSHPNAYNQFSKIDDASDVELFESVYGWMEDDQPHGSAIMLPDGSMFGRIVTTQNQFIPFDRVLCTGDNIQIWDRENESPSEEFTRRTAQAFGPGTTGLLRKLTVSVIGCSGTGSPVIEQLTRLGIGKLLLVDPDVIEEKNLNRILNSTMHDALAKRHKVNVMYKAITSIGIGTEVIPLPHNIFKDKDVIRMIASSDVIFGCVDSVDGRHLLNQIAAFYLIPYFDLGIKLIADGKGGIEQICGSVHYLQPGGASLFSRGLYSPEALRAAGLYRTSPEEYKELKKSGYLANVDVDSPAVISINMHIASMAVIEFLARIHQFRYDSNAAYAINRVSLTDGYYQNEQDGEPDSYLQRFAGRGDMAPLLNTPEFS